MPRSSFIRTRKGWRKSIPHSDDPSVARERSGAAVEDQSAIEALLADPATHGGIAVERIDTHSAVVFLAGDRAYKLKRAVRFPFLDFSTVALRHAAAEAELPVNRRTAPELYLAVQPLTREADGKLALDGSGAPLDWLVVMRRFDQSGLFDRLVSAGTLDRGTTLALADAIAAFHAGAARVFDRGGADGLRWVVEDNGAELAGIADADLTAELLMRSRSALVEVATLLDARRKAGFVRQCHGDLHLRNICRIDGRPVLFDGIEFSEDLACIDVLYDLAFLLMDLCHRGRRDLANLVLNRYLARTGDTGGLSALPLFLACRAAVRAKVGLAGAVWQADAADADRTASEARDYLQLALDCLGPRSPRLVAVGGEPGAGKSTLAERLAPMLGGAVGAVVLRSDVVRKQLFGQDILTRLPDSAYSREASERCFARLWDDVRDALAAGCCVIADATFADREHRVQVAAIAEEAGVPFDGFWLSAPLGQREAQVAARVGDPSDATVDLLHRFRASAPDTSGWHRLDASAGPARVLREALTHLSQA